MQIVEQASTKQAAARKAEQRAKAFVPPKEPPASKPATGDSGAGSAGAVDVAALKKKLGASEKKRKESSKAGTASDFILGGASDSLGPER